MPSDKKVLAAADYGVGWICALTLEYAAAQVLVEEEHQTPSLSADDNTYFCGSIGKHNVVIGCLAAGKTGTVSAAVLATHMSRSFPNLTVKLMVGIGGGAPSLSNDIRLGDIVVSSPFGQVGGVVNYRFGKSVQNQSFIRTGCLSPPPPVLLRATNHLRALHLRRGHRINRTMDHILQRSPRLADIFAKPQRDVLYDSGYLHDARFPDCQGSCDRRYAIVRTPRPLHKDRPVIHYGVIASSDTVLKDALVRDRLAERDGVMCVEMEAAGLMDSFQCLVIRGICDFVDTHKNKLWQGYAAGVAAAYARELLEVIPPRSQSTTSELNLPPTQVPLTLSTLPSTPAPTSGFHPQCRYCVNWRSWNQQLACPMHCPQCIVTGPPTTFRKLTALLNLGRWDYFPKDRMCPSHIELSETKEEEFDARLEELVQSLEDGLIMREEEEQEAEEAKREARRRARARQEALEYRQRQARHHPRGPVTRRSY